MPVDRRPVAASRAVPGRPARGGMAGEGAQAAWTAWRAGDFGLALRLAEAAEAEGDAARHVMVLACHVLGQHRGAIAARAAMSEDHARIGELDETVLWSYAHAADMAGAAFAERRGLLRDDYARAEIEIHGRRPMRVTHGPPEMLKFVDDRLSAVMPGLAVEINGRRAVARLDTGGAWLVMTRRMAADLGVKAMACRGVQFFSLMIGRMCLGLAELRLGGNVPSDVPVGIVDELAGADVLEQLFGSRVGLIVGTGILSRFLVSIDGPRRRFHLSPPGDAAARACHLAEAGVEGAGTEFGILHSHLTLARGEIGGEVQPLFLDSELIAFGEANRQAGLLISQSVARRMGTGGHEGLPIAAVPGLVMLDRAEARDLTAMVVPDRKWRQFGAWGGVGVKALLSWGFPGRFTWTLDFEARRMWLAPGPMGKSGA